MNSAFRGILQKQQEPTELIMSYGYTRETLAITGISLEKHRQALMFAWFSGENKASLSQSIRALTVSPFPCFGSNPKNTCVRIIRHMNKYDNFYSLSFSVSGWLPLPFVTTPK